MGEINFFVEITSNIPDPRSANEIELLNKNSNNTGHCFLKKKHLLGSYGISHKNENWDMKMGSTDTALRACSWEQMLLLAQLPHDDNIWFSQNIVHVHWISAKRKQAGDGGTALCTCWLLLFYLSLLNLLPWFLRDCISRLSDAFDSKLLFHPIKQKLVDC